MTEEVTYGCQKYRVEFTVEQDPQPMRCALCRKPTEEHGELFTATAVVRLDPGGREVQIPLRSTESAGACEAARKLYMLKEYPGLYVGAAAWPQCQECIG